MANPLKSFGNRLNSLPNPLEINQRPTKSWGNQLKINYILAKSSTNQFEILVEIDWTPRQILYNSFGNRLHSLPNSQEINSKSIKFLAKSFKVLWTSIEFLAQSFQNQSASYQILRKAIGNQFNFLTKSFTIPLGIDWIPHQILSKSIQTFAKS